MTVAELIAKLQTFPPEMQVWAVDEEWGPYEVEIIGRANNFYSMYSGEKKWDQQVVLLEQAPGSGEVRVEL